MPLNAKGRHFRGRTIGLADAMGGLITTRGLIYNPYLPTPPISITAMLDTGCLRNVIDVEFARELDLLFGSWSHTEGNEELWW